MNTTELDTSRHLQLTTLLIRNLFLFFNPPDEPPPPFSRELRQSKQSTLLQSRDPTRYMTCVMLRRKCEIGYFINRQLIFLNNKKGLMKVSFTTHILYSLATVGMGQD